MPSAKRPSHPPRPPRLATLVSLALMLHAAVRAEDAPTAAPAAAPAVAPAASAPEPGLASLAWLAGCWQHDAAPTLAQGGEQWTPVLGHALLGVGWSAPGGRLRSFEFMQIALNAAGAPVFVAQPQGQPPTTFAGESAGSGQISFANPAHDFPTRVSYQALPGQRLLARIEGSVHGQPRAVDFAMHRVACPRADALHPR